MKDHPTGDSSFIAPSSAPPSTFVHSGGELPLSNLGQLDLLRGMVERGRPLRTRVRGLRMSPFIRDGDVLTITPMNRGTPRGGEVVAFVQPHTGRLAVHRVVACVDAGWLVRGDHRAEPDGIVPRENMLGVVTCVERDGQHVRLGLGAELAWIAMLGRNDGLMRLKTLWNLLHRIAASVLHRAQALPLYRAFGKRFVPCIEIAGAIADDVAAVYRHFNPFEPYRDQPPDLNVTNWVAKRAANVIGFVQLVYHPKENFPWVGHWLFSLQVWTRYRGLGIGEMLTQRVISQAAAEGAPELLLAVFQDDAGAIRLYRKLGFEQVALPALEPQLEAEKQQFGRRRVVMRKIITKHSA
jgi:GNAT superfamily N-acetyltransferase